MKMAVTHFVTHFTHVSRHFRVKSRKKGKMWSQIFEKMAYWSAKLLLKENRKLKEKIETKNLESVLILWQILGTKLVLFVDSETTF